jgi:hypothetical protein
MNRIEQITHRGHVSESCVYTDSKILLIQSQLDQQMRELNSTIAFCETESILQSGSYTDSQLDLFKSKELSFLQGDTLVSPFFSGILKTPEPISKTIDNGVLELAEIGSYAVDLTEDLHSIVIGDSDTSKGSYVVFIKQLRNFQLAGTRKLIPNSLNNSRYTTLFADKVNQIPFGGILQIKIQKKSDVILIDSVLYT